MKKTFGNNEYRDMIHQVGTYLLFKGTANVISSDSQESIDRIKG